MKTFIGSLLCTIGICILLFLPAEAQERPAQPDMLLKRLSMPFFPPQPRAETPPRFRIPGKKASQYTEEEWRMWIDSTWGPGQTAAQQLNVFDTFWNRIDATWGGFPNISLNWDSIRTLYRPQIGSGLSRGRFAALMSRVWMPLVEAHSYIFDFAVDTTFGNDNTGYWNYKAGVPLLLVGTYWWDLLGAPATALPDSTGLVYRAAAGNPLDLKPGDIILGYEGVPWKKLWPRLLEVGVPVNRYWSFPGSTSESCKELAIAAVGWNWGMFDTIDVVKYATGDTVHLATAPLATLTQNIWATDQVPVPGIPMPVGASNSTTAVSWGVVQGSKIGYIYVWDFETSSSTPQRFADAVSDLRYTKKVEGLIIDLRMNYGGDIQNANNGLSRLFGFDPTVNWSFVTRETAGGHYAFYPIQLNFGFAPLGTSFDRPIAVLIGPGCVSAGDYNAFRLRFHPMARSFGKPTNGGFVAGLQSVQTGYIEKDWKYQSWPGFMVSRVPGEGDMIHKGVQPDEEVWLTRDGVAKGEDDVVKRAIEWMSTLTYAHDVAVNRPFARSGLDSICVTASLTNPLAHMAALTAIVTDTSGRVRDSLQMHDDGAHGDLRAGESIWTCRFLAPLEEHFYSVEVRTADQSTGTSRRLPNAARFSTAGPLVVDSVWVAVDFGVEYFLKLRVRNMGTTFTVRGAKVTPRCADPWVTSINSNPLPLPDLAPGARSTTGMFSIRPDPATSPGHFNLHFETTIDGWVYWTDSTKIVTDVEAGRPLPQTFTLEQNYPNPFNPTTTIRYGLPNRSHVTLTVFNTLGQQVSLLRNAEQEAGYHDVELDGTNLASGLYFYKIQAGDFVATKRLLLLR
jgi:hypothetical protein